MKSLLRYLVIITLILLTVIGIRTYFAGSYRISTDSMKDTLQKGDFVLADKRINNPENPGRNRVVLFKSPIRKDLNSTSLFLSRCIGMPGDTICISEDGYRINGRLLPNSPAKEQSYRILKNIKEPLLRALHTLEIPYRDAAEDSLSLTIRLTPHEEAKLREYVPEIMQIQLIPDDKSNYTFVVPVKGTVYPVNPVTLLLYKDAILTEKENMSISSDGTLMQNGKKINKIIFRQNYYWMMSDNEDEAIDSRHLGLIPESAVIGNVWFCWYSKDKSRCFTRIH